MDNNLSSLDLEYKRYLQIMRPYLGQLVDEEAIKLCNAWIQRLSNCDDNEKSMRNKYIFVLCYQLAKGVLEEPFLKYPTKYELPTISEITDSTSSSEVEYLGMDDDDKHTKVLYNNNNRSLNSDTYQSRENDFDYTDSEKNSTNRMSTPENKSSHATRKQTILCYTCPQMMTACAAEICSDLCSQAQGQDQYEYRANNLIMRLREIKKQNILLHNEIIALKEESKGKTSCESLIKINTATSTYVQAESSATVKSMKNKLQSAEEDRQNLMMTLDSLQEQLDNMHEIKNREMEDMEAKHKMEISKMKAVMRDENKTIYEKKLDELKNYYESLITEIKEAQTNDIKNLTKSQLEIISKKDRIIQEKDAEIQEKIKEMNEKLEKAEWKKNSDLQEKDKIIQAKDAEISSLKSKLEEEKANFLSIIHKFLGKPDEVSSAENVRLKAQELEKRLIKSEKSKSKCIKAYETKFANLQREKHLAECSLQLQLMRQRAQVINEITDENQAELNTAIDKLEAKYKEIIANVQSTAIERRLQDEMTINSIVKAACACSLKNDVNHSHFSGKPVTVKRNREVNQSCDSEISGTVRPEVNPNKSFGDNSVRGGYCLNGEKFGELLEKVYIPQRDYDLPIKK